MADTPWWQDPSRYHLEVERYHPDLHNPSQPGFHSTFYRGGVKYAYVKRYGAEQGGVSKAAHGRTQQEEQREQIRETGSAPATIGQTRFRRDPGQGVPKVTAKPKPTQQQTPLTLATRPIPNYGQSVGTPYFQPKTPTYSSQRASLFNIERLKGAGEYGASLTKGHLKFYMNLPGARGGSEKFRTYLSSQENIPTWLKPSAFLYQKSKLEDGTYLSDPDVRNYLVTTAAAPITGGAFKVASAGIGAIPKVGGILSKAGGLALGGAFAVQAGKAYITAPTEKEKGFVAAKTFTELGMFTLGSRAFAEVPGQLRGAWVRFGAKEVPISQVTAPEVISGRSRFVETSSPQETIRAVQSTRTPQGKLVGVHASVRPNLKSPIPSGRHEILTPTKVSNKPLYSGDVGLFASAKGKAQTFFLKVVPEKYSFNLKKIFQSGEPSPTLSEVEFSKISRLPKSVRESRGFEPVSEYLKSQVGKGKAFISKRSEGGTGAISKEYTQVTTAEGKGLFVKKLPSGRQIAVLEDTGRPATSATREMEFIFAPQERVKLLRPRSGFISRLKGYSQYAQVEGSSVPIKRWQLLEGTEFETRSTLKSRPISRVPKSGLSSEKFRSSEIEPSYNFPSAISLPAYSSSSRITSPSSTPSRAISRITSPSSTPSRAISRITSPSSTPSSQISRTVSPSLPPSFPPSRGASSSLPPSLPPSRSTFISPPRFTFPAPPRPYRLRKTPLRQPKRYTPTAIAAAFDIKGLPKPGAERGGLLFRPVKRKTKGKRKKKK